jgi:hypothetical protein
VGRPGVLPDPAPDDRARRRRRALAALLGVAELGLLLLCLFLPAFRVRDVVVQGGQRMSAEEVVHTAGLTGSRSIFLADSASIRRRLEGATWIRSTTVSPELPDRIVITVGEWTPVAVYHELGGGALYVGPQGQALGPAGSDQGAYLRIDGPAPGPESNRLLLDARLLTALVNIRRGLPGMIGQTVASYSFDRCWNMTMVAGAGWRALFGQMMSPDEYASLSPKLSALKAMRPYVNFGDPSVYVNLMNAAQPAIGHGQDRPPTPTPVPTPEPSVSPSGRPAASPSARPGVVAVTPAPSASPPVAATATPSPCG